jgi:hypothetical protein
MPSARRFTVENVNKIQTFTNSNAAGKLKQDQHQTVAAFSAEFKELYAPCSCIKLPEPINELIAEFKANHHFCADDDQMMQDALAIVTKAVALSWQYNEVTINAYHSRLLTEVRQHVAASNKFGASVKEGLPAIIALAVEAERHLADTAGGVLHSTDRTSNSNSDDVDSDDFESDSDTDSNSDDLDNCMPKHPPSPTSEERLPP